MREWRALFETGIPLYEETAVVEATDPTPQQVLEDERQQLLDEGDFMEYKVPFLLIRPVHFHFKGCWVVFFIFIQILIEHTVSKQ